MTNAQIVALGVRLFAIWLAFYLLRHVPGMWSFGSREAGDSAFFGVLLLVTLALVALVVWLWLFPLFVARKLLPVATLDQPTPLPLEQVERAGFCLLGLWLLSEALPGLVHAAFLFYFSRQQNTTVELGGFYYANVAYSAAALIVSVWLLFGAKGLLGVLRWARTAGTGTK